MHRKTTSGLLYSAAFAFAVVCCTQGGRGDPLIPLTTVSGTIFDADGSRLVYLSNTDPDAVRLYTIATGSTITFPLAAGWTLDRALVTPSGTIFTTINPNVYASLNSYYYNGALHDLGIQGVGPVVAGDFVSLGAKALNTRTGDILTLPPVETIVPPEFQPFSSWRGVAVSPSGSMLAWTWTAHYHFNSLYTVDGSNVVFWDYLAIIDEGLTDGTLNVVSTHSIDQDHSEIILYTDGTELVLATAPVGEYESYFKVLSDYQVANGWVLFRGYDGNLVERDLSGMLTMFDAADSIVRLAPDGEFAFLRDGVMYLHTLSDGTRSIGAGLIGAFKSDSRWFFYDQNQLFTTAAITIPIDDQFNAVPEKFFATSGTILQAVADSSSARGIILNGPVVVDTQAFTLGLTGVLEGSGSLVKSGSGTLVLTADETYTSGTTIFAGTLQIGAGGTAGSIAGDVVDNGTLVFDRSDRFTFGGTISGTGAIRQNGTGILVLNGANTVTGNTTIAAGSLMVGDAAHLGASLAGNVSVGAGGTLLGFGTIHGSVTNNGTVAPGGSIGTLSVQSYTQTSTGNLTVELSPSAASRLHVANTAALNGSLSLNFVSGNYGTHTYALLDAASVSGTFATISAANVPDGKIFGIRYAPAAIQGSTREAVSLVLQPAHDVQVYGDFSRNAFAIAETLNDMAMAHVERRYGQIANADGGREARDVQFWLQPVAGLGSYDGSDGADGFNTHWAGVFGGVDVRTESDLSLGIATAYATNKLTISGSADRVTTDTFYIALDGGIPLFRGHVDVNAHYLVNKGHARRSVYPDAEGAITATASPKSTMYGGAIQYGLPLWIDDLTASARLTYTNADMSGFRENGAVPYDFAVGAESYSKWSGDLRLRYNHGFRLQNGALLVADVSTGMRGIFGSTFYNIEASLADTTDSRVVGWRAGQDRWAFVSGLGIKVQTGWNSFFVHADTRLSRREREGAIRVGATFGL